MCIRDRCEERAQQWLTPAFDEETRKEVKAMLDAEDKSAPVSYTHLDVYKRQLLDSPQSPYQGQHAWPPGP